MSDEPVRFHPIEARNGSELIVFDEHINLVVRVLAAAASRQKDFRRVVRIASAQVFIAKKCFQLIVERSDFGASDLV